MSLKEKMTALADSVRSKSGATGKLSIDKMITAIDSISAGSGGSGDVEYYKCAMVHSSPTEEVLRIQGAGLDFVNGEYKRVGEHRWKHVSNSIYCYYHEEEGVTTPGVVQRFWLIGGGGSFSLAYYYKSVTVSTERYPGGSYLSNYQHGYYEQDELDPAPTVTVETVEIDPETLNTWDGYKAVWDASLDKFTFSKELTTRLPFSNYFTPEVGKIYPADTRLIVERLWQTSAGDVSGVSFSYYQCAAVYGPRKVDGFIVSGAGNPAVNGDYIDTGMKHEETDEPIYKHVTEEFYYITMWGDKGICTSPTQWASDGLYWYDQWEDQWICATGRGGAEPAPTVTAGQVTLDADVPKTWDGYGVYWDAGEGYKFSETLTTGLSYGTWLVPELGKVYDAQAKVEVSKLFESVKPITTNDTACLIYIDGTSLTNKALAPNKHEVTFGSGVTAQDGYLNITNDESGQILTTAKVDGYGGALREWTWDFYFMSDASALDCSGHSSYGWTIEGGPGVELYFRGQSGAGKKFGVIYNKNELVGLSLQWHDGTLHVWNKGQYVGTCTPSIPNCDGILFGIGCIADGDYDRMADKLKFFRFSNKARYVPGQDFELPEGFI